MGRAAEPFRGQLPGIGRGGGDRQRRQPLRGGGASTWRSRVTARSWSAGPPSARPSRSSAPPADRPLLPVLPRPRHGAESCPSQVFHFNSRGRQCASALRWASASARAAFTSSVDNQRPFCLWKPSRFQASSRGVEPHHGRQMDQGFCLQPFLLAPLSELPVPRPSRRSTHAVGGTSPTPPPARHRPGRRSATTSGVAHRPPPWSNPISPRTVAWSGAFRTASARCLSRSGSRPCASHQSASRTWASASRPTRTTSSRIRLQLIEAGQIRGRRESRHQSCKS